jgi:hypothetical protein
MLIRTFPLAHTQKMQNVRNEPSSLFAAFSSLCTMQAFSSSKISVGSACNESGRASPFPPSCVRPYPFDNDELLVCIGTVFGISEERSS